MEARIQLRPASQGSKTTRAFAEYNLLGLFADLDTARSAITALGQAGIEADNISLMGPAADRAASQEATAAADTRMMRYFFGHVMLGGAIGTIAGAILGLAIAPLALMAYGFDVSPPGIGLGVLFGAIIGLIIGALLRHYMPVHATQTWELSFHEEDVGAGAIVGVHSNSPRDVEMSRGILESHKPLELYSVDKNGKRYT
ncbi:MAG TPA: hypothetical protein VNL15_06870 [Dehalococcoidia bacterium]|nr:hypothetical protein [Dehalococcoidia bacterium]